MAENAEWYTCLAKVSGDRKPVRASANNECVCHKSNQCRMLQVTEPKPKRFKVKPVMGETQRGITFRLNYRASRIADESEESAIAILTLNFSYGGTCPRLLPSVQNAETT